MAKVALINPANVATGAIQDIVVAAELPPGRIHLIVGEPTLGSDYQALTIPRRFVPYAANLYGLREFLRASWDCGVIVGETWARREPQFPAYFAYLLGHELGHASTALRNLSHAAYEDIVLRFLPRIVKNRRWRWDELPHELRYDRYGVAIAEEVFGRERVEDDFSAIIEEGLTSDVERLRRVLSLTPRKDLKGILEELAEFTEPYRESLLQAWTEERENGRLKVADGIQQLGALWGAR